MGGWEVEGTDEFGEWYDTLSDRQAAVVDEAIDTLAQRGPGLGRPLVDTLATDDLPNLKELRVGTVRVLFIVDLRRVCILLIGGDKAGVWRAWYDRMIPEAVRLYGEYLRELKQEGLIPDWEPEPVPRVAIWRQGARSDPVAGHTKWSDIKERRVRGPGYQAARAEAAQAIEAALTLGELRKDRGVTQMQLAQSMGRDQGTISRTERQDDLFVSTVRAYVEALGGELELRAVFDDQAISILPAATG